MKKVVIIILILAILVGGGFVAFYHVRDYLTAKMITQLENTDEMQEYVKEVKEKVADASADENKEDTEEKDKEEKTDAKKEEETGKEEKKSGGFWDEPLVKSVYARYSASEIASVSSMAAGGFTPEEKRQVKAIVFAKMSRAELNEIINLYYKYN